MAVRVPAVDCVASAEDLAPPNRGGSSRLGLGVLAVAVFAWWAAGEAGYSPGAWYPGGLLFLVLACTVGGHAARSRSVPRANWALALLAAFTAWSFLSIAWADVKGDAWDGANRTLLYLTVFAVFALTAWRASEAASILGLFAVAIFAIGVGTIVDAVATGPGAAFVDGRLSEPVGYSNASAALFLSAFWPAVFVASWRATPWPLRGPMLAVAGVLLHLALLAQSRGSLAAMAVALVLYLVLVPERWRSLVSLAAIAVVTLACLPPLLDVYRAAGTDRMSTAVTRDAIALGLSAVVLGAIGAAISAADARAALPRLAWRAPHVPALAVAVVVASVVVAGAVAEAGTQNGSRFTGGPGSGRYDMWQVAGRSFVSHPLTGVGADNFAQQYLRARDGLEQPLYPHSLVMRTLSQTGLVGAVLFAGFLGVAFLQGRIRHEVRSPRDIVAAAALAPVALWLVYGSLDWLWELPGVTAPALAWLGMACGLSRPERTRPPVRGRRARPAFAVLAASVAVAAGVSLAVPALAADRVEHAVRAFADDPGAALRELEQARDLNVLSDRADVIAGALAYRAGDRARARSAFLRALDRNPGNWYVHVELAVLDGEEGRRLAAIKHLEQARTLNPREPVIGLARRAVDDRGIRPLLRQRLDRFAVPGPLGPRSVDCRPVLGLAAECGQRGRP